LYTGKHFGLLKVLRHKLQFEGRAIAVLNQKPENHTVFFYRSQSAQERVGG
jgi:hypothetical protein